MAARAGGLHPACCPLSLSAPLLPALESRAHLRLRVDSQGVGHAVDVIEIGNYFHRIQDVAIIQGVLAQCLEVLGVNCGGRASQPFGEITERFLARRKRGELIVVLDTFSKLRIA